MRAGRVCSGEKRRSVRRRPVVYDGRIYVYTRARPTGALRVREEAASGTCERQVTVRERVRVGRTVREKSPRRNERREKKIEAAVAARRILTPPKGSPVYYAVTAVRAPPAKGEKKYIYSREKNHPRRETARSEVSSRAKPVRGKPKTGVCANTGGFSSTALPIYVFSSRRLHDGDTRDCTNNENAEVRGVMHKK